MLTNETSGYLIMGIIFGFTAGISPGPLLTLVITETLKFNKTEGIKVAVAPLITDLPIITLSLLIYSRVSELNILMGIISFLGGCFLLYLGYECFTTKGLKIDTQKHSHESFKKGLIVNILNPHPYLFWLTVGTPIALKALQLSFIAFILYFLSFYVILIGSKIGLAFIVERSKTFLTNMTYFWIMRILGFSLFIFAVSFLLESFKNFIK